MVLKKSDLYSSLWKSCDELRGGMDASQYKDYILTLLFVKYVSDKYSKDKSGLIEVPPGGGFTDMVALKGDKEIGDKINKIIGKLAGANDLQGVIDNADFNDEDKLGRGKEMQDTLSKLVTIFDSLDFRASRAAGDDLLGDAYEYLMRHFATESGKSKGQFYTPAEVSRILAKVVGVDSATRQDQTIYDPTCGSGSLLLKAADEAPHGITIYGQEKDVATWALAKMNMILHGHATADLWRGNTLAAPHFTTSSGLKTFDFVVANPPFSTKSWSNGFDPAHDEYRRFEYGIPPAKNGDYAFLLHVIASLKSTGRAAVILPHGVLFRGNVEATIRKNLLKRGLIKGIIGLPPNLFYGTGIPACVVVVDKTESASRKGVFMIDASRKFIKDGNKNRLRAQDIHKIVDVFTNQTDTPGFARMVPLSEIADESNDYNLNIPRYVDSSEPEDLQDLEAHLRGGIPDRDVDDLDAYWQVIPSLRKELFESADRPGYEQFRVAPQEVRAAVSANAEFVAFEDDVKEAIEAWSEKHRPALVGLETDSLPKTLIKDLSEALLQRFTDTPLLDRYDLYQRLMNYWEETMQDDVYLVVADDWEGAAKPRLAIDDKDRNIKETPDLVVDRKKYKLDLIPPSLLTNRFYAPELAELDKLQAGQASATDELEEFTEEHGGDEGLLTDVINDKGKATKTAVKARLRELRTETNSEEETVAVERVLELIEVEAAAKKAAKEAQAALDGEVLKRCAALTEDEIKAIVVDDKWLTSIRLAVEAEVMRLTQHLAGRVKELEERYASPLPELERVVDAVSTQVERHLKEMGMVWS